MSIAKEETREAVAPHILSGILRDVMTVSVAEAVNRFRQAAIEKGDYARPGLDRELFKQMAQAYRVLQNHGDAGRGAFRRLLRDESEYVRSWAAAQLLPEGDVQARAVLEEIGGEAGLLGFSAKMTLEEHSKGKLKPPFGEADA